jgi:hypothetical protein
MELKVSVSEALALIKEVEAVPAKIFEYIGVSIQEAVGAFLTNLMGQDLPIIWAEINMNEKQVKPITATAAILGPFA